jgi:Acyl-CoA carboxylase epsilon subunit
VADETEPVLRVVCGTPTAEELAALVGALFSRRVPAAAAGPALPSRWRVSALPGVPLRAGPGAWQASGLPTR